MLNFDLINAASFGYRAVWHERKYLLRLALIPLLIKIACTVAIFGLGYEANYIRQGLVMLPASLAEGWLLAQFLRTLLLLERWPIILKHEPNEREIEALFTRARGIMACTIMYTIISMFDYGLKEIAARFLIILKIGETAVENPASPNPLMIIPLILLLGAAMWAFRLLWLYIPLSVLMRLDIFLKVLGGFSTSVKMVGLFLICTVPCIFLTIVLANFLVALTGGPDSDLSHFTVLILSVLTETLSWLIATAAMVYAMRDILPRHPQALPEIKDEN